MSKADEAGIPGFTLHIFKCNNTSTDHPLSWKPDDTSVDHQVTLYSGFLIWGTERVNALSKGSSIPNYLFRPLVVQGILSLILRLFIIIQSFIHPSSQLPPHTSTYSI